MTQISKSKTGSLLGLHNLLRMATYNTRTCRHEGEAYPGVEVAEY